MDNKQQQQHQQQDKTDHNKFYATSEDEDEDVFQDAVDNFQDSSALDDLGISEETRPRSTSTSSQTPPPVISTLINISDLPSQQQAEEQLDNDISELKLAVDLFLNAQFPAAESILQSKFKKSLYFTHGYAVLMTVKSLMTFEPLDIAHALSLLKVAVDIAHYYRKRDYGFISNIQGFVKGFSLDNMTRLQRHAELIYGEAYLLKALITIITEESFVALVREGVNIRFSYVTVKQCLKWMESKESHPRGNSGESDGGGKTANKLKNLVKLRKRGTSDVSASTQPTTVAKQENEVVDTEFMSGVRFGNGIFNLIFSLMPPRALKIFETIGFSGSRDSALSYLEEALNDDGLRHFMCEYSLCFYHTILASHISSIKPDLDLVDSIIRQGLAKYPRGTFILFFAARSCFVRKNIDEAITMYKKSIESQQDWIQLQHVCYWDMATCYATKLDFKESSKCLEVLEKESRWSKAAYKYILAAYLITINTMKQDVVPVERIEQLLNDIPKSMQKIAGKRIPLEKFVARKARKYFMQGNRLMFPIFELMIFWNMYQFFPLANLGMLLDLVGKEIEKQELKIDGMEVEETFYDDLCLLYLIQAVGLREMGKLEDSETTLKKLMKVELKVVLDHYILPFARYEYGRLLMCMEPSNLKQARKMFESAEKDFKKYSMENALHFRVHNALIQVKEEEQEQEMVD